MKTVYHYVLPTMADWETGYAVAELRSQRYFKQKKAWQVRTVAATKEPIVTMGGTTIVPDLAVDDLEPREALLLILPGADIWQDPAHAAVIGKAKALLEAHIPVAAICGATFGLARAGLLDTRRHTSAAPEYLAASGYRGGVHYVHARAVADGGLVTAGPQSPVQFAAATLGVLGLASAETLAAYEAVFADGDASAYPALMAAAA